MGYVLELSDMVGYGAGLGAETWTPVAGLLEFEVTRTGPARPGTLEAVFAAPDLSECGKTVYARQRFQLRDNSLPTDQNRDIIMVGRLDDVEPVQDALYGRVYRVKGRDYLGALADNHIDIGFDNWDSFYACAGQSAVPWIPNWVGNNNGLFDPSGASYGPGEIRSVIIAQLAQNILEYRQGILFVSYPYNWLNSKPIEANYQDATGYTILDAIRNLAREDPWGLGFGSTHPLVDAYDIVMGVAPPPPPLGPAPPPVPFPDAGIGGEFQIDYYSGAQCGPPPPAPPPLGPAPLSCGPVNQRRGHQAMYFKRGEEVWDPGIILQYGTVQLAGTKFAVIPIISYSMPEIGSDIFSRSRVVGTGDAKYNPPAPAGSSGTGNVLQSAEDTWDPVNGLYASRREIVDHDEALTGDWIHEFLPDSENYTSRALRDRAYANLYTGNPALARYRGAMTGSIVLPYFPRNLAGFPIVPGFLVSVRIDHLGIQKSFVVDSWKYSWPANQMTLQLARNPLRSFGEQVVKGVRRQEQLIAASGNYTDLGWWQTDGTGSHRWTHNKGVIPKSGTVQFAQNSGNVDALGRPVPTLGTEISLPMGLTYSPADGQWAGWAFTELTATDVTVRYSINVTYDEGLSCGWLADGGALMRVILDR
jgi:hypothetical protein